MIWIWHWDGVIFVSFFQVRLKIQNINQRFLIFSNTLNFIVKIGIKILKLKKKTRLKWKLILIKLCKILFITLRKIKYVCFYLQNARFIAFNFLGLFISTCTTNSLGRVTFKVSNLYCSVVSDIILAWLVSNCIWPYSTCKSSSWFELTRNWYPTGYMYTLRV